MPRGGIEFIQGQLRHAKLSADQRAMLCSLELTCSYEKRLTGRLKTDLQPPDGAHSISDDFHDPDRSMRREMQRRSTMTEVSVTSVTDATRAEIGELQL